MFPKKTVLVIETEESHRDSIREAFQDCFALLIAKDGNEAVKLFEQSKEPIALVITDLVMPYRSGDVMIEWFRVINPKLPILLFTSSIGSEEVTGLLHLPLVFTLDKMADLRSFASTVEKLCLFSEGQDYQNGYKAEEHTDYDHKENKRCLVEQY
jgi:DNA-binding NtrC family response regulator